MRTMPGFVRNVKQQKLPHVLKHDDAQQRPHLRGAAATVLQVVVSPPEVGTEALVVQSEAAVIAPLADGSEQPWIMSACRMPHVRESSAYHNWCALNFF